jgi:Fur family ferric uptake transcriptional regulator
MSEVPLGPHEALKSAQKYAPSLGIATVYRTINTLIAEGWLTPVGFPGEPPRYTMVAKPHQHYFRCRVCGALFPVDCPKHTLKRLTPSGFYLEGHEMVLYGLCQACQADVS